MKAALRVGAIGWSEVCLISVSYNICIAEDDKMQ